MLTALPLFAVIVAVDLVDQMRLKVKALSKLVDLRMVQLVIAQ
jgi:hypothetical protein